MRGYFPYNGLDKSASNCARFRYRNNESGQ